MTMRLWLGVGAGAEIFLELEPEPEISKIGGSGNPAFAGFFEFLATYKTQKNVKERKDRNVLLQRM